MFTERDTTQCRKKAAKVVFYFEGGQEKPFDSYEFSGLWGADLTLKILISTTVNKTRSWRLTYPGLLLSTTSSSRHHSLLLSQIPRYPALMTLLTSHTVPLGSLCSFSPQQPFVPLLLDLNAPPGALSPHSVPCWMQFHTDRPPSPMLHVRDRTLPSIMCGHKRGNRAEKLREKNQTGN